jgi:hypothetical protein
LFRIDSGGSIPSERPPSPPRAERHRAAPAADSWERHRAGQNLLAKFLVWDRRYQLSVTVSRFLSPAHDPSSILWRLSDERGASSDHESPRFPPSAFQIESPGNVAQRLSARFPFARSSQFFTILYGVLDIRLHRLRYTSAGHPDILHIAANGAARRLPGWGFPIGVGSGEYDEHNLDLGPGDRIYIHSDGLTESMSPTGELYGMERMLSVLNDSRHEPLQADPATPLRADYPVDCQCQTNR